MIATESNVAFFTFVKLIKADNNQKVFYLPYQLSNCHPEKGA